MNVAHLLAVDLNLLLVLDTLLATRSTTATAKKLGRTQSAISHSLARLRDSLGDDLFVRRGQRLEPTSHAESIAPRLRVLLEGADSIFSGPGELVDPAELRATFSIGATDVFGAAMLPRLVARLRKAAPKVDLEVRSSGETPLESMLERREIDAAFGLRFRSSALSITEVGSEDMVVVFRSGHPALGRKLTVDRYCALDHIVVAPRGQPGSPIDAALHALGRSRRVALRVPHFVSAVLAASQTDLVTTLPRSFVAALGRLAPIAIREVPLESPRFTFQVAISKARVAEPAMAFLAGELVAACREVLQSVPLSS
jgi:DNA-binding transcriptional LysR family regulator